MTRPGKKRWPVHPGVARAVQLVAAGCTVALLGTVAAAQSWEPTVSVGQALLPKRPTPLAASTTAPKARSTVPFARVIATEIDPALAADDSKMPAPRAVPVAAAKLETGSIKGPRADDYCANIANPAADARFAWQKKTLADMETEISRRIALLEEKTAEYQKWLARRDEFSRKANETVLRIYARMRPDAAAEQLAALDEETAAAVLTKLEPRNASLILNEMESTQAVRLTAIISGSGKVAPAAAKTTPEAQAK